MTKEYPKTFFNVYVSTGGKNVLFTLRIHRWTEGNPFDRDSYVRNLANDIERAEEKAIAYTELLKSRIGDEHTIVRFTGSESDEVRKRRGKLSADDTEKVEDIEAGIIPFGKYKGADIVDLPDTYLLWLSDQLKFPTIDFVMYTLASVASGIAEQRGLFKIREEKRAAQHEADLKSNHIGAIGERLTIDGTIAAVYDKSDEYNAYFVTKILIGDNIVMYRGRKIGERDEAIKMTAKVKRHEEYNGVKQTAVSHPRVKEK